MTIVLLVVVAVAGFRIPAVNVQNPNRPGFAL